LVAELGGFARQRKKQNNPPGAGYLYQYRYMRSYAYARPESASRRAGVFVGVCVSHALLIWAFIRGLNIRAVPIVTAPLEVTIIPERSRPIEPPPLPKLQLQTSPPITVIAPVIDIDVPADRPPRASSTVTDERTPLIFVSAPPDARAYYPTASRKRGEHGSVMTSVCIDVANRITSVAVVASSGFSQLDTAAVEMARHSEWKAPTVAGKPVPECGNYLIQFNLADPNSERGDRQNRDVQHQRH